MDFIRIQIQALGHAFLDFLKNTSSNLCSTKALPLLKRGLS